MGVVLLKKLLKLKDFVFIWVGKGGGGNSRVEIK